VEKLESQKRIFNAIINRDTGQIYSIVETREGKPVSSEEHLAGFISNGNDTDSDLACYEITQAEAEDFYEQQINSIKVSKGNLRKGLDGRVPFIRDNKFMLGERKKKRKDINKRGKPIRRKP